MEQGLRQDAPRSTVGRLPLLDERGGAGGGRPAPPRRRERGKGLDLSDAIWLLDHLFLGTHPKLPCEGGTASSAGPGDLALADVNGDGKIDL